MRHKNEEDAPGTGLLRIFEPLLRRAGTGQADKTVVTLNMNRTNRSYLLTIFCCVLIAGIFSCISGTEAAAQPSARRGDEVMRYVTEGKDTIYLGTLPAARVYEKMPKQKGREWRRYYRLVHNFAKTYPYALVARKLVEEVDSTIAADNLVRGKRDRYISRMQKELFDMFEKPMRNLTVSQGAMLMKLIDREVGKSSYNIIRDYKNGMAAGFWQGIAKMFGTDLKKPYDPEGEDEPLEELVRKWENGEFEGLYYSLFWKYPPVTEIPSKYR